MTNEQQAAVERLRRLKADLARAGYCYPASIYPNGGYQDDLQLLADAYIAEHRADDCESVTEDWLRRVGFVEYSDGVFTHTGTGIKWFFPWKQAYVGCMLRGDTLPHIQTRGDVRRLCAALNIPLTEQETAT